MNPTPDTVEVHDPDFLRLIDRNATLTAIPGGI